MSVCVCLYAEAECLTGENISEIFACAFFLRGAQTVKMSRLW